MTPPSPDALRASASPRGRGLSTLLLRGESGADVGLFGERAVAAGYRSTGDPIFPQDFTHGDRAVRALDPDGVFRNAYLDRVLGT